MPEKKLSNLTELLARERAAVIKGDFGAIADLGPAKESLLKNLDQMAADRDELAVVMADLTHNQTLLAAAINGISSAKDRLAALAKVRDGLNVYTQSGKLSHVQVKPPAVERKA